jgi:hypothetical protein
MQKSLLILFVCLFVLWLGTTVLDIQHVVTLRQQVSALQVEVKTTQRNANIARKGAHEFTTWRTTIGPTWNVLVFDLQSRLPEIQKKQAEALAKTNEQILQQKAEALQKDAPSKP